MKKILFFLLIIFTVIIMLPTFIVLCLHKNPEIKAEKSVPVVRIIHRDTDEIFSKNVEEYLLGVVASEMPASFNEEALKAQAVAARTYIYNHMLFKDTDNAHPDADVCTDSTHCQAWLSDDDLIEKMGEEWYRTFFPKIKTAVESTKGEILTYEDEPIVAVFHSTGSGRTENAEDVWGNALPYLKSVESAGDVTSPKFSSQVSVPKEKICSVLGITEPKVYDYTRSVGGSVLTVNIGGFLFKGTDIRSYFSLNSANFEIEETDDAFIFHVKGKGHGVGLSQYGANAMAETGSNYTNILSSYYTDVSLTKAW